jgi:hypothetical protein
MKTSFIPTRLATIVVSVLASAPGLARATDYPQRQALQATSLTAGMMVASAPTLSRARADATVAEGAVVTALGLNTAGAVRWSSPLGTRVSGADWTLAIQADGSLVEYRSLAVLRGAHGQGVPRASKMSASALESAARAFIASHLASLVVLQNGETLVPVTTAYRIEGGQNVKSGAITTDMVVANRIVLGRVINGVPVVGGGSTITMTFANNGEVESFRYDWPQYATTGTVQSSVSPGDILSRVQNAVSSKSKVPVRTAVNGATVYPVDLVSGIQLQKLECGYYDPGVLVRDAKAPVQMGCFYHALSTSAGPSQGDVVNAGIAGAVPAASAVEPDAKWQEAAAILGQPISAPAAPLAAP